MHNLLCDYQKVYQMLEDEESRDIYLNRLYVKELVPEYRLYLRHHSNDGRETVLYAVMP